MPKTDEGKDPAAVALGRRGALKGGKARAAALSDKRRAEIAWKAGGQRTLEEELISAPESDHIIGLRPLEGWTGIQRFFLQIPGGKSRQFLNIMGRQSKI